MDRREHLDRYAARGDERDFVGAKRLYELALAEGAGAELLVDYGFLLECHGRNELRRAVAQYERAIELDPSWDRPRYQLIAARAGLREPELAVDAYKQRLAASPGEARDLTLEAERPKRELQRLRAALAETITRSPGGDV